MIIQHVMWKRKPETRLGILFRFNVRNEISESVEMKIKFGSLGCPNLFCEKSNLSLSADLQKDIFRSRIL